MIKIPADAPHICIMDLGKVNIATTRKKLIAVNPNYIYRMPNPRARRYLIKKLWKMTHTKQ